MTELIEKTTYEDKVREIRKILSPYFEEDPYNGMKTLTPKLQEYIAKEVELAYKAGMLKFNALDHTFQASGTTLLLQWHKEDLSSMGVGEGALLPSLYLQAKGFKK